MDKPARLDKPPLGRSRGDVYSTEETKGWAIRPPQTRIDHTRIKALALGSDTLALTRIDHTALKPDRPYYTERATHLVRALLTPLAVERIATATPTTPPFSNPATHTHNGVCVWV